MKKKLLCTLLSSLLILLLICPWQSGRLAAAAQGGEPPKHPSGSEPARETSSREAKEKRKEQQILTLGQLIKKYPETFKIHGPRVKEVALTFDDVPDPRFTPQILDVLKAHHIKATFFVMGSRAKKHPELVERIVREGHVIGNHSYNHPVFHKLEMDEYVAEIKRTENTLYGIVGYKPKLIRPPYGDITERQLRWAKQQGYKIVNWNVDSLDWKGIGKEAVKRNVLSTVGQGSIILQHAGGGTTSNLSGTIDALPDIIRTLKNKGYSFVTLPRLLHVPKDK
ncbi:polysaccharide deacetylase family protein [Paenibacillus sp. S28]|uniref:polysaccharide deacetylase family protein n=1 Tax=Paenibacillus sp. S28 TaxID=2767463 RepID=UPI00190AB7A1|nr:polysaccharide deacetylase family protein [Paenibacillus sp. S28]MBJ9992577.1 polysaccharide deacetylase family protein [Paenibacillus sp. S28]